VIAELGAEALDMGVERAAVGGVTVTPNGPQGVGAVAGLAGVLAEIQ
jgi:hypothetical protein